MGKNSNIQWKDMKDSGSSDTILDWMMCANHMQMKRDDSDQWDVKRCKRKLERSGWQWVSGSEVKGRKRKEVAGLSI